MSKSIEEKNKREPNEIFNDLINEAYPNGLVCMTCKDKCKTGICHYPFYDPLITQTQNHERQSK